MTALAAVDVPRETTQLVQIPLELVDVGENVRVNLDSMEELAASIAEHGVIQPVKAVLMANGRYRLVWGQRRVLAARKAGLEYIPALLETVHDELADSGAARAIEQLVENLLRADLNPLDRAQAIRAVVDAGRSQADLARELGLHPSTIANDLGLLDAPKKVQQLVESGELTPSHAKAMKGLAPKTQTEIATEVVRYGYSAHRTEEIVQDRRRRAEREAEEAKKTEARQRQEIEKLAASIAELATKKKPGLDTEIVVFVDYYGQGDVKATELAKSLTAAGFTKVRMASGSGLPAARPTGGICDCTAWKATLHSSYSYQAGGYVTKLQVTTACIVAKHREAKASLDSKKLSAGYALQTAVEQHVKRMASGWAIPNASAIAIDRILAEAALWGILSYRLPDWSVAHGGKRNTAWQVLHALPDEELATELAQAIAGDFRDKAGYHVDWTGLAAELGVEAPA